MFVSSLESQSVGSSMQQASGSSQTQLTDGEQVPDPQHVIMDIN